MPRLSLIPLAFAAATSTASAQPGAQPAAPDTVPSAAPTSEPGPVAPAPAPAPDAAPARQLAEPATDRPSQLAFAIGIGYAFPTPLETPNTTSVRIRLASGLTFEPQLVFAASTTDIPTGGSNKTSELTLGSLVRYPLRRHHRVDLEAVGSLALSAQTIDPAGDNNNTTNTAFNLDYGFAISYWFSRHWNLSLTATNPLITVNRTRQEVGVNAVMISQTSTIGLVFDPQITAMIHLYD